jgi:carbonic anhydrase
MSQSNETFDDLFAANNEFAKNFQPHQLTGRAIKGLAIVTCMDSRIDPLKIVGMKAGDAKILRNAGARVTEDVLRTLILATHLLNVSRVLVMPHTDCRMASGTEPEVHAAILEASGVDTRSIEIRTVKDQRAALETDVTRIRTYPLLPNGLEVIGAIYHVENGTLEKLF